MHPNGHRLRGDGLARTLGPTDTEAAFALHLHSRDVKQMRVPIELPPDARDADLIGRHVRVLITDEQPGPTQRALAWLFSRLGA